MISGSAVLVLGGTRDGARLADATADALSATALATVSLRVVYSLAGVTDAPKAVPQSPRIDVRTGGFGGKSGLLKYLRSNDVRAVVDATHPFATTISAHAAYACEQAGVPRAVLTRSLWHAEAGDRWERVESTTAAAARVQQYPAHACVFLTVGSRDIGPFVPLPHRFVVRAIKHPPALPANAQVIIERGPFDVSAERARLRQAGVACLVTKNSGGAATVAKLHAARDLSIPVIMIERPAPEPGPVVESPDEALAWVLNTLLAHP